MVKTVTLADGQPCKVRQLGLFELDGKGRDILGPYQYTLLMATGQLVTDEYDLRALDEIPQPPDKPASEIEPNTDEWEQLKEWETYQAALAHEKPRIESYEGYVNDIAGYILANCLDSADRNRVQTADDWDAVYSAALVEQLTERGISDTLRDTFPGFIWDFGDTGRADVNEGWQGEIVGAETMGARDD